MNKLFIFNDARDYNLTRQIKQRLKNWDIVFVDEKDIAGFRDIPIEHAKKHLFLTIHKGKFIKPFPIFPGLIGGKEYFVFHNFNCFMDCQYCFLQGYFEHNIPTIFVNQEQLMRELELSASTVGGVYHFGEMGDALLYNGLTNLLERVNEVSHRFKRALFEFRTKSAYMPLTSSRSKNIVLSWTITPQEYIDLFEIHTASLASRLTAAERAQSKGYRIGLHFDPIIANGDWRTLYAETIERVFKSVAARNVYKVSLGVLRFNKELYEVMRARFRATQLLSEEFYEGIDKKMRYFRFFRVEIYRFLVSQLLRYIERSKIYLCMETPEVWKAVFRKDKLTDSGDM